MLKIGQTKMKEFRPKTGLRISQDNIAAAHIYVKVQAFMEWMKLIITKMPVVYSVLQPKCFQIGIVLIQMAQNHTDEVAITYTWTQLIRKCRKMYLCHTSLFVINLYTVLSVVFTGSTSEQEAYFNKQSFHEETNLVDPDQPNHAAQANPDRHCSPPVDFLFQESLLYTSIPQRRNLSVRNSMCGLRRLIQVDILRRVHDVGTSRYSPPFGFLVGRLIYNILNDNPLPCGISFVFLFFEEYLHIM